MNQRVSTFLRFYNKRKICYWPFIAPKLIRNSYRSQSTYAIKAIVRLSVYFRRLRITLDNEQCAALIVDRRSGSILSNNLPAFELFEIDTVGFRLLDFIFDQEAYESIIQQLQQIGESHQTVLLHNADGYLLECEMKATIAHHYAGWMIFRFSANRQSPYPLHLSH